MTDAKMLNNQDLELSLEFSQRVLCNAMVAKVSPSWTKDEAKRLISSILNLRASACATAVIDVVNSHEFIISPLILDYMLFFLKCLNGIMNEYVHILTKNRE